MSDALPALPDLDDAACQRALAILLEIGTSLAQELKSPSAETTLVQRAAAFPNVALAVRRTIILSRHITNDPRTAIPLPTQRADARRRIIREVEDTIGDKADPADADALRVELLERIDQPEFDTDLAHRSPTDLIRELCRDLGLFNRPYLPSYLRRTPDDIAILCAQAAAETGATLARWSPQEPSPLPPASPPPAPPSPDDPAGKRCPPT
ncbi:MAG: hypothetical protein M3N26_04310 [Pseudomonadota bacterium]|nr:hypothetical protein [Pseudomonadota bacterium]